MNRGIVARIEVVIEYLEMSVSAFADEIGVQRSSMSHLLNGRNKPSLDFIMKLVDTYPEVGLDWLLRGKGSFPSKEDAGDELIPQKNITEIESGKTNTARPETISEQNQSKEPYKIVMFYKDGTFTTFNEKKD
ncbi:MAG: helix-turn-helix domain-containing protein [Flavobacteriaceae bacterium]|nr:helix-turn-helix domain-containing protein [Flavobacteriaceae bacterium]